MSRNQAKVAQARVSQAQAPQAPATETRATETRTIRVPSSLTVRELANLMHVSPIDVIKQLMSNGIMATINQQIDFETAAIVASDMGFEVLPEAPSEPTPTPTAISGVPARDRFIAEEDPSKLKPRPPVVAVLGHVDHGKTTLLDRIRATNVTAEEAGGITQHIGAYQVTVGGRKVTFLDTPGHEAFTAMRARGAQVTDLVILVVAADDGVMPQTREAIEHARAAQVPILVALNKIDKSNANPERVKQQLADVGLLVEEWGGDVICVPVSAKMQIGIDELLENIFLVTDVADLRANPDRPAQGTVIESAMDERQGAKVTLLVQNGTLRVGDVVVIGTHFGKVRAMFDDRGNRIKQAGPSTPVAILGFPVVPLAGERFEVVASEHVAREIVNERLAVERAADKQQRRAISLEEVFTRMQSGETKEINIVLKADVQGSLEPIVKSVCELGSQECRVHFLRQGTGNITESDVMLAIASSAIVIGFNVSVDPAAQRLAETEGVDIRLYNVIYRLIEDLDKALKGKLEPTYQEVITGHAEVRAVFKISRRGNVAGTYVLDGQITRNSPARLLRNGEQVYDGAIASLRRFTEDVPEVNAGYECGIALENFQDYQVGDIIECYKKERVS